MDKKYGAERESAGLPEARSAAAFRFLGGGGDALQLTLFAGVLHVCALRLKKNIHPFCCTWE